MIQPDSGRAVAIAVMIVTPLLFSTNLIFGRGVVGEVAPFLLAFVRWLAVALVLSPFAWREREGVARLAAGRAGRLLLLGFLGMWLCGAVVYIALAHTTATNGTLIYATSPVFILLLDSLHRRRPVGLRAVAGSALALLGIATIVLGGRPQALLALELNPGDLLFVVAAIAWAVYSLLLRGPGFSAISNLALLSVIAASGALTLLPFAIWEVASGAAMPASATAWRSIGGIVLFASLLAFLGFQFGVRRLGAPLAGIFMYLMPPYGVLMAVVFLGERFQGFHAAGILLVMGGVVLATLPADLLKR